MGSCWGLKINKPFVGAFKYEGKTYIVEKHGENRYWVYQLVIYPKDKYLIMLDPIENDKLVKIWLDGKEGEEVDHINPQDL